MGAAVHVLTQGAGGAAAKGGEKLGGKLQRHYNLHFTAGAVHNLQQMLPCCCGAQLTLAHTTIGR